MPLDGLTGRFRGLAQGGGGGATASSRAPTTAPRAAKPDVGAAKPTPGVGDVGSLWSAFLERVRDERLSLYLSLAAGRPLGLEGGTLRVGVEAEALRRELNRKESLDALKAIASGVAGRALQLEIAPLPAGHVQDTPAAQAKRRTEETLADPLVQAAVEIFGAEVRSVRDRRS